MTGKINWSKNKTTHLQNHRSPSQCYWTNTMHKQMFAHRPTPGRYFRCGLNDVHGAKLKMQYCLFHKAAVGHNVSDSPGSRCHPKPKHGSTLKVLSPKSSLPFHLLSLRKHPPETWPLLRTWSPVHLLDSHLPMQHVSPLLLLWQYCTPNL